MESNILASITRLFNTTLSIKNTDMDGFLSSLGHPVEDSEEGTYITRNKRMQNKQRQHTTTPPSFPLDASLMKEKKISPQIESFLLFAQEFPANNLGFVDSRAHSLEVTIHGNEYTIQQSPSVLSSARAGGTTGAVLWKITPFFAEWISGLRSNPLWTHPDSPLQPPAGKTVVELGCGIAGLVALSLGPWVQHYVATDQEYVHRLLRENLDENKGVAYKQKSAGW